MILIKISNNKNQHTSKESVQIEIVEQQSSCSGESEVPVNH